MYRATVKDDLRKKGNGDLLAATRVVHLLTFDHDYPRFKFSVQSIIIGFRLPTHDHYPGPFLLTLLDVAC
jgi:hypothetical protein